MFCGDFGLVEWVIMVIIRPKSWVFLLYTHAYREKYYEKAEVITFITLTTEQTAV